MELGVGDGGGADSAHRLLACVLVGVGDGGGAASAQRVFCVIVDVGVCIGGGGAPVRGSIRVGVGVVGSSCSVLA